MNATSERLTAAFERLSVTGLLLGAFFFAGSLTPSLIPRHFAVQGVLSGLSLAVGYGLGRLLERIWAYVQAPQPAAAQVRTLRRIVGAAGLVLAVTFLWLATGWQNDVRDALRMPHVDSANPVRVGLIAFVTFCLLMTIAWVVGVVFRVISTWLKRHMPERAANLLGFTLAALLVWSVVDGVIFRLALKAVDSSYRELDARIDSDIAAPLDPGKTGSRASLLDWQDLGRRGREFVVSGPTKESIEELLKAPAAEPIRVYAGLNSAETPSERARLALAELKRVGGFEKSVLVVVIPTGTGWVDPAGVDTVEYLHRGDVASVAVQYSYLSSWLSLLIEPDNGAETAHAVFDEVYRYWTTLPRESRPRLYLHGLSLGALNSQRSADLFKVIGDPFDGAVWSGTPFQSRMWRTMTAGRQPGSPAWLPVYGDSSAVRFTNQDNHLLIPGAQWGPMRMVMLQYASDPITFFEPAVIYREPEWMRPPRGPDVPPSFRWIPILTFLQLVVDITICGTVPPGRGHVFSAANYIDAWKEVSQPPNWSDQDTATLKAALSDR